MRGIFEIFKVILAILVVGFMCGLIIVVIVPIEILKKLVGRIWRFK